MAVLYERHRDQALKFARSLMSSAEDAEDVLHEAFAKAVSAIRNGYGPTDRFGPYLSTCVRSAANSVWIKQARERPAVSEELDPGPAEDLSLERVLSVFEHEDIAAAMRTLPERWRTVLWRAEVMGEPPRAIAPLLGIEPNAVSALLIRARAGLRAAYDLRTASADGAVEIGELN
jgi:RNA polymerase sigma factor (sigma-70 family)